MPDISQIKLPSGTVYNIKDTVARQTAGGGLQFRGVTTTALTDLSTTTSYKIGTETLTAANGDLVIYDKKEFLFSTADNKWHELGDNTSFKALAYKDSASGSYTPAGTISQPTFTGTASTVTITATDNTNGNYQPKGTVSTPTFTGSSMTSTGKFKPAGSVSVSTNATTNKTATVSSTTGTATYTPAGTVAAPTFTGTEATIESSATYKPKGSITFETGGSVNYAKPKNVTTGMANSAYTPTGTVGAPTISVATAGSTTTIKNPTSVTVAKTVVTADAGATAPSNPLAYASVSEETLILNQIGYTTGDSITTSNVTVKTGDASYNASAPSFTGDAKLLEVSTSTITSLGFVGTQETIESTATYTPAGTNSAPAFTGTGARLVTGNIPVPSTYTATFTGTEGDVSVTGTPEGTVSQTTFTGTKAQISGTVTPAGTVSKPTFTGTAATITVS